MIYALRLLAGSPALLYGLATGGSYALAVGTHGLESKVRGRCSVAGSHPGRPHTLAMRKS